MLGTESSRQHPMKEYRHGSCHKSLQNVGLGRPEPWPEEGPPEGEWSCEDQNQPDTRTKLAIEANDCRCSRDKITCYRNMRCTNRYDPAPSPNLKQHEITFWTQ